MKLIHARVNENYAALLQSGIDSAMAKIIAAKLRLRVILDIMISDTGLIVEYYDTADHSEKRATFAF